MAAIDALTRVGAAAAPGAAGARPAGGGAAGVRPFGEVLKDAIAQVNALQLEAQQMAEAVARGDLTDMHRLALAVERAQLALELTVAVRNKLVEAYQEISRMPI
ncbi:MAG TPA: flagellar hook-basal body complex protein FliE [Limnochordales bacterium]